VNSRSIPIPRSVGFILPLMMALSCCAASTPAVIESMPALYDPLYKPDEVRPGRLEYAPNRSTFAPILTERFPYPTQSEANAAYRRLLEASLPNLRYPASVRLFACQPGALDKQTARVMRYPGPVVDCATDFLGADGRPVRRETVNYFYHAHVWTMRPVFPPRGIVSWRDREQSPKDFWRWLPGRGRYE
jgi:hypothetical protein